MPDQIHEKFSISIGLLQPFEPIPNIAVAVSGGADSLALMILTNKWLKQIGGGNLTAITVNHNLRDNSLQEALEVGSICQQLNIKHIILEWQHEKIVSNIQAKAREARYELLTTYCRRHDILHLFTGHQLEDAVENFFIKLSRASGIFGLIQSNTSFINNVRICKPILNLTKSECYEVLKNASINCIEDPSNTKRNYFRNDIRLNLQSFFTLNSISPSVFQKRIAESQKSLCYNASLTQDAVISAMCDSTTIYPAGFVKINLNQLSLYDHDVQHYLLTYLLIISSGNQTPPRSEQIKKLLNEIYLQNFKAITLNKCIIDIGKDYLIIYKEPSSISTVNTEFVDSYFWDNRFRLSKTINCDNLSIGRLDLENYSRIKNSLDLSNVIDAGKHKHKILFTLPAIKKLEKVIAMPNIDYYEEFSAKDITSVFEPQYTSKIIHHKINKN
jgi:tRNA(Ile)-lysidine synthase